MKSLGTFYIMVSLGTYYIMVILHAFPVMFGHVLRFVYSDCGPWSAL